MKVRVKQAEIITDVYKNGRRAGQQYQYCRFHLGPISKYRVGSRMAEIFYRMFDSSIVSAWNKLEGTLDPTGRVKTITEDTIQKAVTDGILDQEDLTLGTSVPLNTEIDVYQMPLEGKFNRIDDTGIIVTTSDGKPITVTTVELTLMRGYDATTNEWKFVDDPQERLNWLLERYYIPATEPSATVEAPVVTAPPVVPSTAQQALAQAQAGATPQAGVAPQVGAQMPQAQV